ncbi:MAG: hypothetical protein AB7T10_00075 [bacterium]
MKKLLSTVLTLILFIFAFSLETGKMTDDLYSSRQFLQLSSGVALNEKFAIPSFKVSLFKNNLAEPVYSMTLHNGHLIAGGGGIGKITDLEDNSIMAEFSEGEIVYTVLSLDSKTLIAALQPKGIIVKLSEKKVDTIFSSEASINLLKKTGGVVYAAVGNEIYVYSSGKFEKLLKVNDRNILYFEEINGDLYISTEGKGKLIKYSFKEKTQEVIFSLNGGEIVFFKFEKERIVVAANSLASGGEGMEVYSGLLLSLKDSAPDTLAKEDFPYSCCAEALGGVLLTASVPGRCYFYDFENYLYLGSSENDFIMSSYGDENIAYIATAEANSIIKLSDVNKDAEFSSSVIDPQKNITVTAFYPRTKKPGKLFIRTGNTFNVDSTWSPFMLVKQQENESLKNSRYLQYKYRFSGIDDTLYNVSFFFKTVNHAPKFRSIKVYPERVLPDYAATVEWDAEFLQKRSFYPELKDNSIYKSKRNVRFFLWECFDIDMDKLIYDISLISSQNTYLIKKSFFDSFAVVNLESFPEGWYRAKVVASDSIENNEYLKGMIESEEFFIDRTPASIIDESFEKNILSFTVKDNFSLIDNVEYSVNGESYKRVLPLDGVCDSKTEKYEIKIEREKGQTLSIIVKATDASGNYSVMTKAVK